MTNQRNWMSARAGVHTGRAWTVIATGFLMACGGGGGDGGEPPAPASLTLAGTAATGAAVAAAAVEARCANGTGTATTAANGSYTISIPGGQLPCALRVAGNSVTLHSVASGSGLTATAQITPLTELVLAQATGREPAAWFSGFVTTSAPTAAELAAATVSVGETLAVAGVQTAAIGDPITAVLQPASGSAAGNGYDQALDLLGQRLAAAGTPLAQLSTALAAGSPRSDGATKDSAVPSIANLFAASDADCAGLRSGRYRIVAPGQAEGWITLTAQIDTAARTVAFFGPDGSQVDGSAYTSLGTCRFALPQDRDGNGDVWAVSAAGFIIGKLDGGFTPFVAFPEQAARLADLAGQWNVLDFDTDGDLERATVTISAGGQIGPGTNCPVLGACSSSTQGPVITVAPAPEGGFVLRYPDGNTERLFVYRSGSGAVVAASVWRSGSFAGLSLLTHVYAVGLPAVGSSANSYDLAFGRSLRTDTAITANPKTIDSLDTAARSWTRRRPAVSGGTYVETVLGDTPATGFTSRNAATVTDSTGAAVSVGARTALRLVGMGGSVVALPGAGPNQATYNLSVDY